ncbi:DUF342 domain-containing protein [Brevibacillus dissolubilis]|uniref:DUF342 domain-containing protein n=1 Tax=Brevibacillus dissolubilis TaxID=1844116 RepID=UPI0011161C9D|nr:FapA family protein [Brevibacillus dissolubilis]
MSEQLGINIKISKDKMAAELLLQPADQENWRVTVLDIKAALRDGGVHFGILDDVIDKVCKNPTQYINIPVTVAVGLEATPGKDARIEFTQQSNSQERKPLELEDGRVDFYSVLNIANVMRGQLLARKIPSEPGIDGTSVTGDRVVAKAGKEVHIKPGKNVVLNEDRTLLYAAIDGQVSITDKDKINVFPVFEVNGDVDFRVGNIDFVGTVVIRGNVPTGFRIKAAGDIRVLGSVEGAELEAQGSVEIKNGIVAQDKGHVLAGADVKASYIQNGNVTARGSVYVTQSIMFSTIRAGKDVICKGTKGIIIGGTIQAGDKITAMVVGNSTATPTCLEVGVKPELRNELANVTKELTTLYENLRKTDQGLGVLDQLLKVSGELPADKKIMQIKLTNTRIILDKDIKKLEQRKRELEESIEGDYPAVVEVYQITFPGVKLVFGKWVRFIKQEHSRSRFLVLDGEITASPIR